MDADYPQEWKDGSLQRQVKALANHTCEQCGMKFHPNNNLALHRFRRDGRPMVGTVHHIDGNKENSDLSNLVFLCQSCHYLLHIYDWFPGSPLLLRWYGVVPAWIITRNIPYIPHPQMLLFSLVSDYE